MTEDDFWAALAPLPITATPTYRLYYDDQGFPLFYSMEAVPGNYIEIDAKTWHDSNITRVVDGKIIQHKSSIISKLVPTDIGTACDPNDITVVVAETVPHVKWSLK
jgi:hypothetical protein